MLRQIRSRIRGWLVAGSLLLVAGGCAVNPVTGERQFTLVSEAQEIQMGQQAAQEVAQSLGLVQDEELQAYVSRVGQALAARSERPELPWSFAVVDDPTPNAFALPGGFIFVTRGMMSLMDNESELAAVLGHEIGHVTARHSVTQISRAQLAQLGLGIGQILFPQAGQIGAQVLGGGLQLLFLHYGRDAERQADELGFNYALAEGYDVREMADVFASLQRVGELEGQSPLPTWQASHPAPAERIENVRERLATLQTAIDTSGLRREQYLARIDGMVFGENPRNGYFREGVFLHPELRFRMGVPSGWRTQNLSQAVMAMSPQQDAMLQLTLAEGGAEQAARAFLSQQGLQPVRSTRERINGLPAVVSYFRAQSQQGEVQGLVAHIEYNGRTYQILGYAPAQRFAAYDRVFGQVIGSFGPLTDPQFLNVQPDRVDIVRLERRMSLAEFNRAYPSAVPLEMLAVLNQVTDVNAPIPLGTRLKRVVQG